MRVQNKSAVVTGACMARRLAAAVQRHGTLDVVLNHAGWTHRNRPALEVSEEAFDQCHAVKVKSIFLATLHATIPLGRFSTALDVANAVLYQASDEAGARCV